MLAHHLIFAPYGRWLPNAPRGSWSHFVGSWQLFLAAGPTTKDHPGSDHPSRRAAATNALSYKPILYGLNLRAKSGSPRLVERQVR